MPMYTWLRPRKSDSKRTLESKQRAANNIKSLQQALESHIQAAKRPDNTTIPTDRAKFVRIATWNLREFDSASYGYRTQEAKAYIAEILSHFDLVALQEIREDLGPLNDIKYLLGHDWDYIVTDVTQGDRGNRERMAFLYNTDRIWFRKVTGELTLPHGQKVTDPFGERFRIEGGATLELPAGQNLISPTGLKINRKKPETPKLDQAVEIALPPQTKITLPDGAYLRFADNARVPVTDDDAIAIAATETPTLPEAAEIVLPPNSLVGGSQQFARTPFIASFQAGWLKLNLATVHIYYGKGKLGLQQRKEEIQRFTELLAERAESDNNSDADSYFVALGDFNIIGKGHETMAALESNGFEIPEPIRAIPDGSNVKQDMFYDQIALWSGESSRRKTYTRIVPYRAGVFDFFDVVFKNDEEAIYQPFMKKPGKDEFYKDYMRWRTYQISDHLPMWVELHCDFAYTYLEEVAEDLEKQIRHSGE